MWPEAVLARGVAGVEEQDSIMPGERTEPWRARWMLGDLAGFGRIRAWRRSADLHWAAVLRENLHRAAALRENL